MQRTGVRYLKGKRNDSVIVTCGDGFYYHVRELRGQNRVRLRCRLYQAYSSNSCRGTANFLLSTGQFSHGVGHNHLPDPLFEEDQAVREVLIHDAKKVSTQRVRAILDQAKLRLRNPELASRFTRSLYRARSGCYPRIPKTLLGLGILLGMPNMRPVCKTVDGQDYIFQGVVGHSESKTLSVIFASGRMLNFLGSRRSIHADGTFKKRPRKPKCIQIFNIVVKHHDVIIGVVRVLMRRRTEEAYVTLFTHLKMIAVGFDPDLVHCDFERAQMNGFATVFPQCRIVGCFWHYAVCMGKQAKGLGLGNAARDNTVVFNFVRSLCAVPLLPQYLLWQGVKELWAEVGAAGWGDAFLPLFQYYEETWQPHAAELSVFGVEDRTNNCSESDNHMLGNAIPQNHPGVWSLIGGFVQMEYLGWVDKVAIDNLRPVTAARKVFSVLNDRRVQRAQRMLVRNDITAGQFLLSVSEVIHAAAMHGLHLHTENSDSEDSDSD